MGLSECKYHTKETLLGCVCWYCVLGCVCAGIVCWGVCVLVLCAGVCVLVLCAGIVCVCGGGDREERKSPRMPVMP